MRRLLVAGALLLVPVSFGHAATAVWNKTYDVKLHASETILGDYTFDFDDPAITVHYGAHIENAATGALLLDGTTIPVGTQVRFQFHPHAYTDISWVATGGSYDTPYGDWTAQASAPPIACLAKDFLTKDNRKSYQGDLYAALSVQPPPKTLSGLDGFACQAPESDGSRLCTATKAGSHQPTFIFGGNQTPPTTVFDPSSSNEKSLQSYSYPASEGTYGFFYPRFLSKGGQCGGSNKPMTTTNIKQRSARSGPGFVIRVPVQSIPFNISIIENAGEAPSAPSVTAAGECTLGTPHTLSFTATDPDGDQIRYGVDWNSDGTVDQFVPPSGYVSSGTAQNANRTYTTEGPHTVKVFAEDENGNTSPWGTTTFSCTEPGDAVVALCADTIDNDGDGLIDLADPGCIGLGDNDESDIALPLTSVVVDLRVIPSLVKRSDTTKVNWSAEGVDTCTVTAPNGDTWTALASPIGGETSSPITGETTYTLTCIDPDDGVHTETATVRIIPLWRER